MPWIEFTGTFRWRPKANVSVRYSEGMRVNVTQRCADAAIEKGLAIKFTDPEARRGKGDNDTGAGQVAAETGPTAEGGKGTDQGEDGGIRGQHRRDDEKSGSGASNPGPTP